MKKTRLLQLFLCGCVLYFFSGYPVLCQNSQVVQTNDKIVINSKILNESRDILIRVPSNYAQTSEKYPVVYLLDGQASRITLMTGTIENLVDSDLTPEMILVSIPNTIRPRDMTPSVFAGAPVSGGADNFIKFIETEVMPEVEKKYRVQPYKILVGHSLSGLLVGYAFVSRPELFSAYLAASPFLQWDSNFVLKRGEEWLKSKKELNKTLFFALGDEPSLMNGFNGFKEMLNRLQIKNLDYEILQIPGENHWSTNIDVFNKGLRKVWSGWRMPSPAANAAITLPDLENHYKLASAKYGYQIPIPEMHLNSLGSRLLREDKTESAIEIFEKNISLYPDSMNAYNNLAGALEKSGQLNKAKENFEKALKLAEKNNNSRLIEIIKENLKRVSAKL